MLLALLLLLLTVPEPLAAQDNFRLIPVDDLSLTPPERTISKRPSSEYRLLLGDPLDFETWTAVAERPNRDIFRIAQTDAESSPPAEEARKPNRLFGSLIPVASLAVVAANSLIGYSHRDFHVHTEGWFGEHTRDGGADKASHFADYYIVAKEIAFVYEKIGYSTNEARWWGFGVAVSTGLANEVADGFTRHGFSWEDFAMDTLGAGTAVLLSATRTEDLFGIRTSHVPSDTYTHDVYAADLKLSGLANRLGVNLGPLRWLNFSFTYGTKGYRVTPPIEEQRQIGLEIGLNLQQILNDLRVTRSTWWGYALHMVGDNVRFPYLAVGMRYDLNHGKWHGPNAGNFD